MPRLPKKTFTKRTIDSLPVGPATGTWFADRDLRGFYCVSYPHSKFFAVRFLARGRRRMVRIGRYGTLTLDQARDAARDMLAAAALGRDPYEERQAKRLIPSFGEWVKTYLERVRQTKKRPEHDEHYLGQACERWKERPLNSIKSEDVEALRSDIGRDKAPTANRFLASVGACFSAAIRAGHIDTNPAGRLRPYKESPPRARVLTDAERKALAAAIDAEEDLHARAALTLLMNTGARLTEALRAKWEDLDLVGDSPSWRIPSTKAGRVQAVPLPPATAEMLRILPKVSPYVVAGRTRKAAQKPRRDLKGPWSRALGRAGLSNAGIHVHDLRRDFGRRVYQKHGLIAASRLLRHRDVRVTSSVYTPESMRDLAEAVTARESEVIPFPPQKAAGQK